MLTKKTRLGALTALLTIMASGLWAVPTFSDFPYDGDPRVLNCYHNGHRYSFAFNSAGCYNLHIDIPAAPSYHPDHSTQSCPPGASCKTHRHCLITWDIHWG